MQTLANYIGRELIGRQPKAFKMDYELRESSAQAGEGELVASLNFRSAWGTLATGQSADGSWTYKRVGFFTTHVTIRTCDTEEELAVFRNNTWTGGGALEFPDGRNFPAATNFWMTQYDFRTREGHSLVLFQQTGLLGTNIRVTIQPDARSVPEIGMMTLLGWYLMIMMQNDSAAGAAAAAAV